jgi:hypothetical protein
MIAIMNHFTVAMAGFILATGAAGPDLTKTQGSIHSTALLWTRFIAVLAFIVCGILLIVGGREGRTVVKVTIASILGGIAIVVFAASFTDMFFGWIS